MNIITKCNDELFAIVVDSVGDVIEVEQMRFSPPPPTLDETWRSCCSGVYQLDQGLLLSLEISNLLNFTNLKLSA